MLSSLDGLDTCPSGRSPCRATTCRRGRLRRHRSVCPNLVSRKPRVHETNAACHCSQEREFAIPGAKAFQLCGACLSGYSHQLIDKGRNSPAYSSTKGSAEVEWSPCQTSVAFSRLLSGLQPEQVRTVFVF